MIMVYHKMKAIIPQHLQHGSSRSNCFGWCVVSTGLWACTSECKILGHSDRCWSPSATRANTSLSHGPHLSTFSKTASLPQNTLQRDTYYQQAHLPKTNGLQSVYEKVQHQEFDYILVCPPTPARIVETGEISLPEYGHS